MKTCIPLLLTVITFASVAVAQSKKDKIEIGVQSTSLTLFHPDFPFDDTQAGIGGRVTYNFNRSIAAEAEINFFPQKQFILTADGSAIQAQFGVKLGKRFNKFGLFGKVRPGFLSVNRVGSFIPGSQSGTTPNFTIERRAFFTIDTGGVLELYPSRRTVVRFEAGDTAIRHPVILSPSKQKETITLASSLAYKGAICFRDSLVARLAGGSIDGGCSAKPDQDLLGLVEFLKLPSACRYRLTLLL